MSWKFTDESKKVVFRENIDGTVESKAATLPDILAAIDAGQVLNAEPKPDEEPSLSEQLADLQTRVEALEDE